MLQCLAACSATVQVIEGFLKAFERPFKRLCKAFWRAWKRHFKRLLKAFWRPLKDPWKAFEKVTVFCCSDLHLETRTHFSSMVCVQEWRHRAIFVYCVDTRSCYRFLSDHLWWQWFQQWGCVVLEREDRICYHRVANFCTTPRHIRQFLICFMNITYRKAVNILGALCPTWPNRFLIHAA